MYKLTFHLLCMLVVAACDAGTIANEDIKQRATVQRSSSVVVILDIRVGVQGQVLETRLADGQADTLFAKAAMLRKKQQQFAIRYEDGEPIEYWLHNVPVQAGQVATVESGKN